MPEGIRSSVLRNRGIEDVLLLRSAGQHKPRFLPPHGPSLASGSYFRRENSQFRRQGRLKTTDQVSATVIDYGDRWVASRTSWDLPAGSPAKIH